MPNARPPSAFPDPASPDAAPASPAAAGGRRRRTALIAPLPPIRSGVARHSAAVGRALAARPDVELRAWSFARQYPRLLYPGAAERDPRAAPDPRLPAREILRGASPASWRRTAREVADWAPDLVILPAWTFFLAPALAHVAGAARRAGAEVRMIVHNAFDHEEAWWKSRLSLMQLSRADAFLTHNAALAGTLAARLPGRPAAVFPHPVFDDLPEPTGALPRRAPLELLFFGLVRPYKGLDLAIDAFAASGRADARLTIAGEFWDGLEEARARIARLGLGDRVEIIPRFVSDAEAAELFARADAALLPYRSATGSGVIPTACRYGRAAICSDLPGLASVVEDGRTGRLFPAGDADALARIIAGLDRDEAARMGAAAAAFGRTLSWERFAALLLDPIAEPGR